MKELITAESWNEQWQLFRAANAGSQGKKMDQGEFWNRRAKSFAHNTVKSKDNSRFESVLQFLTFHGAFEPGMSILDIGSGPGSYAIPFARLGARVVALDPSSHMLSLFRENTPPELIDRIEMYEGLWEEADIASLGWHNRFDLVFASMCPGINEQGLIDKMMACSRNWCYISAFSGPRHFQVYDEIFMALDGRPYPNHYNDIIFPFNLVYALGYKPAIKFVESSFIQKESYEYFTSELNDLLTTNSITGDERIEDIVKNNTFDGQVHQLVQSCVGMMVWNTRK